MVINVASGRLHNLQKVPHCAFAQMRYALGHDGYFKAFAACNVNQDWNDAKGFARRSSARYDANPRRHLPQFLYRGRIYKAVNTPYFRHNHQKAAALF